MDVFEGGRDCVCLAGDEHGAQGRVWRLCFQRQELGLMTSRILERPVWICDEEGSVSCQVNQENILLRPGEGLFVNRQNALRLTQCASHSCRLRVIELKEPCRRTQMDEDTARAMETFLDPERLFWKKLRPDSPPKARLIEELQKLAEAAEEKAPGWELERRGKILVFWAFLLQECSAGEAHIPEKTKKEKEKLLKMLAFLHEHFREKLTLSQMAENSGVSSGDYSRFFKRHMGQTPLTYLNLYRIGKSLPDILGKTQSITRTVLQYGFGGSSYYAETFHKELGCTPVEYRKWYCRETSGPCPLKGRRPEKGQGTAMRKKSMPTHLL